MFLAVLGGSAALASELPLARAERGQPLVEVAINGKGPFTMVLDTAAGLTTVTTALKDELGLVRIGRSPQPMQLAGGAEPIDLYTLGFVALAGMPAPAPITVILDKPLAYLKPARGILGMNVLSRFAVDIDQPNRRLTLSDFGAPPPASVDWNAVPFAVRYDDFIVVDVEIGGVRAKAVIDTGANGTIVNDKLADALGIAEGGEGVKSGEVLVGGGKTLKTKKGPLVLARASWREIEVQAVQLPLFKAMEIDDGPAMILGNNVLAQVRLFIDYKNDRLYLTLPPSTDMVGEKR
jgi:predicted aspartyl protease